FFLPLPNGVCAVGEGAGGGAKATGHKGSAIAVWHPGARLNSHRTFSFLDSVRQHMASFRKIANGASLAFARFCAQSTPENYRTQIFADSSLISVHQRLSVSINLFGK
ncbi:MAG TPA: hypothetical protein PLM06_04070, partial [Anaerolineae bacterium]|nr:hypothetical protein [Anaerolineae bacterium]